MQEILIIIELLILIEGLGVIVHHLWHSHCTVAVSLSWLSHDQGFQPLLTCNLYVWCPRSLMLKSSYSLHSLWNHWRPPKKMWTSQCIDDFSYIFIASPSLTLYVLTSNTPKLGWPKTSVWAALHRVDPGSSLTSPKLCPVCLQNQMNSVWSSPQKIGISWYYDVSWWYLSPKSINMSQSKWMDDTGWSWTGPGIPVTSQPWSIPLRKGHCESAPPISSRCLHDVRM